MTSWDSLYLRSAICSGVQFWSFCLFGPQLPSLLATRYMQFTMATMINGAAETSLSFYLLLYPFLLLHYCSTNPLLYCIGYINAYMRFIQSRCPSWGATRKLIVNFVEKISMCPRVTARCSARKLTCTIIHRWCRLQNYHLAQVVYGSYASAKLVQKYFKTDPTY